MRRRKITQSLRSCARGESPCCSRLGAMEKRAERRILEALTFAHATHEESFVISWKIMYFIPQQRAKIAPFRPVADGFRRLSIEILYDRALWRAAKAGPRLRFSRLSSACYAAEQGNRLPVISLNLYMSNSSEVTDMQRFQASNPGAARPAFPCWQGITGKVPVWAKLQAAPGAKPIV